MDEGADIFEVVHHVVEWPEAPLKLAVAAVHVCSPEQLLGIEKEVFLLLVARQILIISSNIDLFGVNLVQFTIGITPVVDVCCFRILFDTH